MAMIVNHRWSSLLLLPVLLLGSCQAENLQECITDFDPTIDYFPHKAVVEEAELFSIEYFNYYKIVRNLEDSQTYVLVQCGAPTPPADEIPDDVAFIVEIPFDSVALQYSTMEAFYEVLGNRRTVQAILGTSFSTGSCMIDLVDAGLIIELNDTEASLSADYVNEQGMLETNPTLDRPFSVDTISGFIGRTLWNPNTYPFEYIRTSDTLEPSRVGLFEKVKFYATFLNKEERANEAWTEVIQRVDCVRANAAEIELEAGSKTKILWGGYSGFCQAWDVSQAGPFYYNDFADICSADILSVENGGNFTSPVDACFSEERMYMDYDSFLELAKDADVWIWPSPTAPDLSDTTIFTPEIQALPAYVNGEFYYAGGSVGWYDQAYIQPDVLIEDFCSLAGTLDLETGEEYQRVWFSNVFTNDVNTPNPTCEELGGIDTPRATAGSDCILRTAPPTPAAPAGTSTTDAPAETPTTDAPVETPSPAPSAGLAISIGPGAMGAVMLSLVMMW